MTVSLPDIPVAVLDGEDLLVVTPDGDIQTHSKKTVTQILSNPVILCNAPLIAERFDIENLHTYDVLELFAFVRPGKFCVPTPIGIAQTMQLETSKSATDQAMALVASTEKLLSELQNLQDEERQRCIITAQAMAAAAPLWTWAPFVLEALNDPLMTPLAPFKREQLNVWKKLPEWEEKPPRGQAGQSPVSQEEARIQLSRLVEEVVQRSEPRPEQADYASALSAGFQTPQASQKPTWIMAEAGTGVGKTLGYLAPSLAWATKNDGQIWISTFTRHLQNQLQQNLDRIFPASDTPQAVIRKGRENYLCLLNLEEAVDQLITGDYKTRVGIGLMLRWTLATRNGDLTGGDLPGWLPVLVGTKPTTQLSDRRGECIHQTCPHYSRCFIERGIRQSHDATVIVANHALTLVQPFGQEIDDSKKTLPTRVIFDEGHHLFDATDSAFSISFSGNETGEMKRWLIGEHSVKRFRRRGLSRRMINILGDNHPLLEHIQIIREAAQFMPEPGWLERVHKNMPKCLMEEFLMAVRAQVLSREEYPNSPYSLETAVLPLNDDVAIKSKMLAHDIHFLMNKIRDLFEGLKTLQDAEGDDTLLNRNIFTLIRSVTQRCLEPLQAWYDLMVGLNSPTPEGCADWLGIDRIDGRDVDIGVYRHYIDPMKMLVDTLNTQTHSVIVTSATLKPNQSDNEISWAQAEQRVGAKHLREQNNPALRVQIPSPFDYPNQTRVFLINDVDTTHNRNIADAYTTLFKASGGGALGLFTAIKRLQATHPHIRKALAAERIPLYAQHVDGLNTATLVDIFRAEEDACLLGTDALRDGVDVPGRALRLVVYDRIPWPRPDILHKARRDYFGKRDYDLYLTGMRLRQSFGRLIRTAEDHGVFVLLESALPSALYGSFPAGVSIEKTTLLDASAKIKAFLNPKGNAIMPPLEEAV